MRKRILLISAILFFLFSYNIFSQVTEFKILLLHFSNSMKKKVYKNNFSYPQWIEKIRTAKTPKRIARLILIFEQNIKSRYKQSIFEKRRKKWLKSLKRAVSISETAEALYKLEVGIKFTATYPRWLKLRKLWVKKIQSLY